MIWNKHYSLEGKHAFLSPSKYHWIFDNDEEFERRTCMSYAAQIGTLLHEEAKRYIQCRYRLTKNEKRATVVHLLSNGIPQKAIDILDFDVVYENLMAYVRDAVSFKMAPEVILYYSEYCFGTADAILYDDKARLLRIHDLKTGTTPAKMEQLDIYTALFFLEYSYIKLADTKIELRIYQNNEIITSEPSAEDILPIMDKIKSCSNYVSRFGD